MITVKIGCKKHPRYMGKRKPQSHDCDACWHIYRMTGSAAGIPRFAHVGNHWWTLHQMFRLWT